MALAAKTATSDTFWTIDAEQRVVGLMVVLLKQSYVLPWSQFLYAESTADQLRAVFTTHDVRITGVKLTSLLSGFAAQQITELREPARAEKFASVAEPRITTLVVIAAESASQPTSMARARRT